MGAKNSKTSSTLEARKSFIPENGDLHHTSAPNAENDVQLSNSVPDRSATDYRNISPKLNPAVEGADTNGISASESRTENPFRPPVVPPVGPAESINAVQVNDDAGPLNEIQGAANNPSKPSAADPHENRPRKKLLDLTQRMDTVGNLSQQELQLLSGTINTYGRKSDMYYDLGFYDKAIRMNKFLCSVKEKGFGADSFVCIQEQLLLAHQYVLYGYPKRALATLKEVREKLYRVDWEHPPQLESIAYLEKKLSEGKVEPVAVNDLSTHAGWTADEADAFLDKLLKKEDAKSGSIQVLLNMDGVVQPNPAPIDPNHISTLGIRLSFVYEMVIAFGGVKALGDMTTTDICMKFVKPMTEGSRSSLCDLILQKGYETVVQPAKFFISHAWMYKFADVVEALDTFFDRDGEANPDQIYIWFDLFTNSQHDTAGKPFDWWEHRFLDAIREIQNVVMILTPWTNPIPLTRAWCVYEVLACARTCSNFDIAMPTRELISINDGLLDDPEKFHTVLESISSALCQATNPADKENIFRAVRKTVGFPELDKIVLQTFENWIVSRLDKVIDKPGEHRPGEIRRQLNNSIEAEEGEEESLDPFQNVDLVSRYHFALGYWRMQQGRFKEAWDPIKASLTALTTLHAFSTAAGLPGYQDRIDRSSLMLATVYKNTGLFAQAHQECLDGIINEILGPGKLDDSQMLRLAPFLAIKLSLDISEGAEDLADTLKSVDNLAIFLLRVSLPNEMLIAEVYEQLCRVEAEPQSDRATFIEQFPETVAEKLGGQSGVTEACKDSLFDYFIRFGKFDSAEKDIKSRINDTIRSEGIDASSTQKMVKKLFRLFMIKEDYEQAELVVNEQLKTLAPLLFPGHVVLLDWKKALGKVEYAKNRLDRAKDTFNELIVKLQENLGGVGYVLRADPNKLTKKDMVDRRILRAFYYMGICASNATALSAILRPQQIFYGQGDFDFLDTMVMLAELQSNAPNGMEFACGFALDAYQRSKYFHGDYNKKTIEYSFRLGKFYHAAGKNDEADAALGRAFRLADANVGPYDPLTLQIIDFVADRRVQLCSEVEFDTIRSEGLIDRAYRRRAKILGETHPTTLRAELAMAKRFIKGGLLTEAADHIRHVLNTAQIEELKNEASLLLTENASKIALPPVK